MNYTTKWRKRKKRMAMTGQDCQWCGRKWEQLPGSSGVEEGRRCAYLPLYWPSRDGQVPGQRNRGVPGSDWLSENLVVCQECGFQLSSFLLEKKKKKDAGDSGTSHQGPFPAKKGLRGRNHFVIHGIAVRCFLLTSRQQHSWYRFLTGELTWVQSDNHWLPGANQPWGC